MNPIYNRTIINRKNFPLLVDYDIKLLYAIKPPNYMNNNKLTIR